MKDNRRSELLWVWSDKRLGRSLLFLSIQLAPKKRDFESIEFIDINILCSFYLFWYVRSTKGKNPACQLLLFLLFFFI